ncbi:type II toxin-antitoxin system RelE/ParE family toxin [Burkholderia anthina]|uniref:type II toxin-antitoxin system RelE/ParE family toxin n=1 Tax=Burkholderia anthina TaxID=179879 RepID=UPI001CF358FE|nr:type II toxin-antitoxin system RelE/ParE family toxin [Burkholderia anthina]MCA8089300.1 type II toxin-antitoxin system RelE/ParE family toxin [Burkholderia anthina]
MSYQVRYTPAARENLVRLYGYLLERDAEAAARTLEAIERGVAMLRLFPFTCCKLDERNPFLRELIVSFGTSGHVLLFEIESAEQVSILSVRHRREDDYH